MNTLIYPIADTYITSAKNNASLNFGIDEILVISSKNNGVIIKSDTPSDWHVKPERNDSIGTPGWVAMDDDNLYSYTCCNNTCNWYVINKASGSIDTECPFKFLDFSGSFYTTPEYYANTSSVKYAYLSGSSGVISGGFSGTFDFKKQVNLVGIISSCSFCGTLNSGSTFDEIYINNEQYQGESPLSESISGCGVLTNYSGSCTIKGKTTIEDACTKLGTFIGQINGIDYSGIITTTEEQPFSFNVNDTCLYYFGGNYLGDIVADESDLPSEKIQSPTLTRTLLKFDLENIFTAIRDCDVSGSASAFPNFTLRLTTCQEKNIPYSYKIYAYPVSQSWDAGVGRNADGGSKLGVSWLYRDYISGSTWFNYNISGSFENVDYLTDDQYATESFKHGGGTWYYKDPVSNESLLCTQSFDRYASGDVSIDITPIVKSWYDKTIHNNGIILMTSREIVDYTTIYPEDKLIEFFSRETNTIYSPHIKVSWVDSRIDVGELLPVINKYKPFVIIRNLQKTYKSGEYVKMWVYSRNNNKIKTFNKDTQQPYMVKPEYLPERSYYMIKDAESEMVILDFSDYTQLSCDPIEGNYFYFDTTGFPLERYYKILIKSEFNDGSIVIFDVNKIFKIIR